MWTYWLLKQKSFMTFFISHDWAKRKSLLARSRKKWLNYKKWRKTSARSFKEVLFVYRLFVRLVRKSKKKQTVVAILNKLAVFFFCGQVISIFFIRNLGKPLILCIIPGKPWKIQKNTLENPWKPWNSSLKFGWQPS